MRTKTKTRVRKTTRSQAIPGTLNATIGGTATFQAGVFGDLTTEFSSATRPKWSSTSGVKPIMDFYTA